MTQKLPFNNTGFPVFPVGDNDLVLFHRFSEPEGDALLWTLSMWVAVNFTTPEGPGNSTFSVFITPRGETPSNPDDEMLISRSFSFEDPPDAPDVGDQGRIYQIAFDYPIRGPVDLWAASVVPVADQHFVAWGYVKRGDAVSKTEKRFLDSGAIGNQVDSFTGGKGVLLNPDGSAILHETVDGRDDEVTLDLVGQNRAEGVSPTGACVLGWSNAPLDAAIVARFGGYPIRIFDGIPFRGQGELAVDYSTTDPDAGPIVLNGSFARG